MMLMLLSACDTVSQLPSHVATPMGTGVMHAVLPGVTVPVDDAVAAVVVVVVVVAAAAVPVDDDDAAPVDAAAVAASQLISFSCITTDIAIVAVRASYAMSMPMSVSCTSPCNTQC